MKENIIKSKSFDFAVDIVYIYKKLVSEHREYVMSQQLLKPATSIGANVREAEFAVSKPDYINKMTISLKEANETDYWLDLLNKTAYLADNDYVIAKQKIEEILRILVSIIKSSKQ